MYQNSLKTRCFGGVSVCVDHFVNRPLLHFEYHLGHSTENSVGLRSCPQTLGVHFLPR
jgi:hypothetical protein